MSSSSSESEEVQEFGDMYSGVAVSTVNPSLVSWCPVMDMIMFALDTKDGGLVVYRVSGQVVWSLSSRKIQLVPKKVAWRHDGRAFALLLKDGSCRVYNTDNGKLLFNLQQPQNEHEWTAIVWNQLQFKDTVQESLPFKTMLKLDPIKHIPKLPSIQGPASETSYFVQRAVMEEMIHNNAIKEPEKFEISVILCGSSTGVVSITLYNILNIGSIQINPKARVISINSKQDQTGHVILATNNHSLTLVPITLSFINEYGPYLADVTVTPAQVMATLEYIKDSLNNTRLEMNNMVSANSHFFASLNETINESEHNEGATSTEKGLNNYLKSNNLSEEGEDKATAESLLLDSLLTGSVDPAVENWIQDYLRERGIKKWRKQCFYSYDHIRRTLFDYLLPACERLILFLTELRGLGKWKERGPALGIDADQLDVCITQVAAFTKMANDLIWSLNRQFGLFRYFCTWIEILFEEITGVPFKDQATDGIGKFTVTSKVVEYITEHIHNPDDQDRVDLHRSAEDLLSAYEVLNNSCCQMLESIKSNMLNNTFASDGLTLVETDANKVHANVRIIESEKEGAKCCIAMYKKDSVMITVAQFNFNGTESINNFEIAKFKLGSAESEFTHIEKAQFVSDTEHAISVSGPNKKALFTFHQSPSVFENVPYRPGCSLEQLAESVSSVDIEICRSRLFDDDRFVPAHFTINNHRGVGCIIEKDLRRFILFDAEAEEDGDED